MFKIIKNKIYLNLSIDESNFKQAYFIDSNAGKQLTKYLLCKNLKDNFCSAGRVLSKGMHNSTIIIVDKAGNENRYNLLFGV
jgi:hypothetical protein